MDGLLVERRTIDLVLRYKVWRNVESDLQLFGFTSNNMTSIDWIAFEPDLNINPYAGERYVIETEREINPTGFRDKPTYLADRIQDAKGRAFGYQEVKMVEPIRGNIPNTTFSAKFIAAVDGIGPIRFDIPIVGFGAVIVGEFEEPIVSVTKILEPRDGKGYFVNGNMMTQQPKYK